MPKTKSWKSIKKGFQKAYKQQAKSRKNLKGKDLYKRGKGKNF